MSIGKSSTTQLVFTKDDIAIDRQSTNEGKAIKGISSDSNEVDNVDVVDTNRTAKFKYLIKTGIGFLIPGDRLAFIKLRKVFIKALIFHYFDPKYHI